MPTRGTIGHFEWVEVADAELEIPTIVAHLAAFLRGLTAVNVSWDSGQMPLSDDMRAAGWSQIGRHAVSPVVTENLLNRWPHSACLAGRFDEWYFFRSAPTVGNLVSFCNYSISLGSPELAGHPGAAILRSQLKQLRPEAVIGEGDRLFVI